MMFYWSYNNLDKYDIIINIKMEKKAAKEGRIISEESSERRKYRG